MIQAAAGLLACVLASAAAAGRDDRVELVARPSAGAHRVHAIVLEHDLVTLRMSTRVAGIEQSRQDGVDVKSSWSARIREETREVEDGRPTSLRRVYEDARLQADLTLRAGSATPRIDTLEAASPLSGCSVLFTWAPARGDYGRLYDQRESSDEFLPRLAARSDLADLLPGRAVAVGESWAVAPEHLGAALTHGGEIPLRFTKGADNAFVRSLALGIGGLLDPVFDGPVGGDVRATLRAVDDGPEGRRARIDLEVDLRVDRDQTALVRRRSGWDGDAGTQVQSSRLAWSLKGRGELVWSLAGARAISLTLTGAEEVGSRAVLTRSEGEIVHEIQLSGGLKHSVRIDDVPARR